jgi:putative transposase
MCSRALASLQWSNHNVFTSRKSILATIDPGSTPHKLANAVFEITSSFAGENTAIASGSSPKTDFVLDALEQALHDRRPVHKGGLIHHSDRGGRYLSIRYTERLALAGIEPSVGSVGDSYDNALAETINGLYKAEVIHRLGPWKTMAAVEWETLKWVYWFNNRRLLGPIGYIPAAEAEERYYAQFDTLDIRLD